MSRRSEGLSNRCSLCPLAIALMFSASVTAAPPATSVRKASPELVPVLATRHDRSTPLHKVDADLLLARTAALALQKPQLGGANASGRGVAALAQVRTDDSNRVQCYVHVRDVGIVDQLRRMGMIIDIVSPRAAIVQGWIPFDRLEDVAALGEVVRIRPPAYPVAWKGSRESQGVSAHRAAELHALGIDGAGVRVGVISDGIAGLDASVATGDLPDNVVAESTAASGDVEGSFGGSEPGAEGTAMLEIVHDLAPGAELFFANCDSGLAMAEAIRMLADKYDCDVIIDDLGFLDEPFFEDGHLALTAQEVAESGRIYASALGNAADGHYQGMFVDSGEDYMSYALHDFGGGDTTMDIRLRPGQGFRAFMQWNTPFDRPAVDLDFFLMDSSGTIVAGGGATQGCSPDETEGIALEGFSYTNTGDTTEDYALQVLRYCPDDVSPELELYILGFEVQLDHIIPEDSGFGHPIMPDVIGCGAIDAAEPGLDVVEYFSSRGPMTVYLGEADSNGLLTGRVQRDKPDVCGVDGVTVTGHGGFPSPFYGTSAAAPHVGACAALLMQAYPNLSAAEVRQMIVESAVDVEEPGYDYAGGAGIVDVMAAFNSVSRPPVAEPDAFVVDEDTVADLDVMANDTDPGGDALRVSGAIQPSRGRVVMMGAGILRYRPEPEYQGPDAFVYTIEDEDGYTASAEVRIEVRPVNDPPVAADDVATTPQASAVSIDVLANDSDIEGGELTVLAVDEPANGTAEIVDGRTVTYAPDAEFTGQERFEYTVVDDEGATSVGEVRVTVTPVFRILDPEDPQDSDEPVDPDGGDTNQDGDGREGGIGSGAACGVGAVSLPMILLQFCGLGVLRVAASRRR